jgi:hypothetical protein
MMEFEGKSYLLKEAASRFAITSTSPESDRPTWSSLG